MNNRLVIVGAGGHGKVVADNALKNGYKNICFVDDREVGICFGFPIVGTCADLEKLDDGVTGFVVGIGNNAVRKRIAESHSVNWISLVHPSAQVAEAVSLGDGTVVMAAAVINADSVVGKHSIINTGAIVEHDNVIGDYVHISPKAALGGTVSVGSMTHVGIGATVINNIAICDNCVIGAGGVVVKNIDQCGTYIGVPAKVMV